MIAEIAIAAEALRTSFDPVIRPMRTSPPTRTSASNRVQTASIPAVLATMIHRLV